MSATATEMTICECEAGPIREAASDVLAGVKLATIADRWNSDGVQTVMVMTWPVGGEGEPILDDATQKALAIDLSTKSNDENTSPLMYGNRVSAEAHYKCDTEGCTNSTSGRGVDASIGQREWTAGTSRGVGCLCPLSQQGASARA